MNVSRAITVAFALSINAAVLTAQPTMVTSRNAITGTTLGWYGMFGAPPQYSLSGGETATVGDMSITVNAALPAQVLIQGWGSWPGNFTTGDEVLHSIGGQVEFLFSADIFAFGSNIQSTNFSEFVGTISAFDIFGNNIATYNRSGVSTWGNDGSAIFLGVGSDVGIRRIVMSTDGTGVAINQAIFGSLVSENEEDGPGNTPPLVLEDGDIPVLVNPEPATVVLFGAGMLLVGAVYRRRKA